MNLRFTVNGNALYAIILGRWPQGAAVITSLADTNSLEGKIDNISLLGGESNLKFTRDSAGLNVELPTNAPSSYANVLKITGLKMNPSTWTDSGNPQ